MEEFMNLQINMINHSISKDADFGSDQLVGGVTMVLPFESLIFLVIDFIDTCYRLLPTFHG
jgi:hypothetical protein